MIDGNRMAFRGTYGSNGCEDEKCIGEHDQFPYSAFEHDPKGSFVEPQYMGYSDYSGSLVERSNVEEFMEQFSEHQGKEWWELYGGHGTRAIVVRRDADDRVPEIGEFFAALDNYPLANEERHRELEMQQQNDDWDSYGRGDFSRWLAKEGLNELVAPFIRGAFAEKYPKQDAVFDTLPDETILAMVGGDEVWEGFADSLPAEALNDLWFSLVRSGSGSEMESEGQSTVFRYEDAFENYYTNGAKGAGLEEVFEFTKDSMQAMGLELEWQALYDWATSVEAGIGPVDQVQVLLDYLQERGGEWDEGAERILRAKRLGRYAA